MPNTASVSPTNNGYIDGVLTGTKWATSSLTFSFPAQASYYGSGYGGGEPSNNFEAFSPAQQAAVRSILASYSAVANMAFSEVQETSSQHAVIRYAETDKYNTAFGYYPSTSATGGDTWFNNSRNYYDNPVKGNYGWFTIIHETGHALGLKHPQDSMGSFGIMPANRDSLEYTVMSYRSYVGAPTDYYRNGSWDYPQTLMMYDIAAVQTMYGANYSTNSGNSIYQWRPDTGEMFINGVGQGAPGSNKVFMTLWDGGGTDTYDFSAHTANLTVSLQPGEWTTLASKQVANLGDGHYAAGNVANALMYNGNTTSLIENAIGGSGNDTIKGNAADNTLTGRGGNDIIDGQGGINTATYSGNASDYQYVHNADGSWGVVDLRTGSPDGADQLRNIKFLQFNNSTVDLGSSLNVITVFQQSFFSAADTPALTVNDGQQVEVGVKFTSSVAGSVTGIKFYRAAGDTGPDVVDLWSSTGTLLATGTFSNTSASGWQTVTFSSPVAITAGSTYVASYHTTGAYADTRNYFTTAHTNGSLTAPASAGVYAYGGDSTTGIFPTNTYQASNYFVDVAFAPASQGLFSAADTPALTVNDGQQVEVGVKFTSSVAGSVTGIKFYRAAGDTGPDVVDLWSSTGTQLATGTFSNTSASGWQTVTFSSPVAITAGSTYVASYHTTGAYADTRNYFTTSLTSGPLTAPASAGVYAYGGDSTTGIFPTNTYQASNYFVDVAFNPDSGGTPATQSFFSAADTPALTVNDGQQVEVGVKFTSSVAGSVTGIKFYRAAGDTGPDVVDLWSSTGTLLATGTFSNTSASGWQTVTFSSPVAITAGSTYVASYHTTGAYADTRNYFTTAHTNGSLTAPASAGVYAYGGDSTTGIFPTNTYQASNYFVDVAFNPDTIGGSTLLANDTDGNGDLLTITGVTNLANSNGTASFNTGVDPYNHFMETGWKEGRNPNAVFSTKDYLDANPDVAASGMNPLTHFEMFGWKEGRDPSPHFDVGLYLIHNPEVQAAGINPLDHYLLYGQTQGRTTYEAIGSPNAVGFDAEYYLFHNPDVAAAHVDPYQHYLAYGWKEGRDPSAYFDTDAYLAANPDVAAAGVNPLLHYDRYGWKEGRDPSGQFDTSAYLAANPDVAAAGMNPLVHYEKYGIYEGRDCHAVAGGAGGAGGQAEHVDLFPTPAQNTVVAGSDALSGFENGMGSTFNDKLHGIPGHNVLESLGGNDRLAGAGGNDTFLFNANFGRDTIKDFAVDPNSVQHDMITFDHTLFADYDAVMAATSQVGADTVITVDAENAVTLLNLNMSSLHRDDFTFV